MSNYQGGDRGRRMNIVYKRYYGEERATGRYRQNGSEIMERACQFLTCGVAWPSQNPDYPYDLVFHTFPTASDANGEVRLTLMAPKDDQQQGQGAQGGRSQGVGQGSPGTRSSTQGGAGRGPSGGGWRPPQQQEPKPPSDGGDDGWQPPEDIDNIPFISSCGRR